VAEGQVKNFSGALPEKIFTALDAPDHCRHNTGNRRCWRAFRKQRHSRPMAIKNVLKKKKKED